MSYIETHPMQHSTIQSIHADWDSIEKNPPYQRNGDVWSLEKKQLLIDSIINRYDIPKIYFHKFSREDARRLGKEYSVIDGRQRLETIIKFIEGRFTLGQDFEYLEDEKVKAAGMNYSELAKSYPKIKSRFDAFSLPIITVETDEIELIEDMFSRLNEAVPLNSAEKRRSIGGDVIKAVDEISEHNFFKNKVRFSNRRYQHKEVAIRLIFLIHNLREDTFLDTKKVWLDAFAKNYKRGNLAYIRNLKQETVSLLDGLETVFTDDDTLLAAQATIAIYFLAYRQFLSEGKDSKFTRNKLVKFNDSRMTNRLGAEENLADADYELLEYDRLSQQGTNDANSIKERVRILHQRVSKR